MQQRAAGKILSPTMEEVLVHLRQRRAKEVGERKSTARARRHLQGKKVCTLCQVMFLLAIGKAMANDKCLGLPPSIRAMPEV